MAKKEASSRIQPLHHRTQRVGHLHRKFHVVDLSGIPGNLDPCPLQPIFYRLKEGRVRLGVVKYLSWRG